MDNSVNNSALIYTVFPHAEQAKKVARILVQEKLIACANILPAHIAIYEWQGKLAEESEVVMLLKTSKANYQALEERIKELHEYDVPCIIQLDISAANADFLAWIANSVK
jgi:periplasmic divalent cation tolerance protein